MVQERIMEEKTRVESYLDKTTDPRIIGIVERWVVAVVLYFRMKDRCIHLVVECIQASNCVIITIVHCRKLIQEQMARLVEMDTGIIHMLDNNLVDDLRTTFLVFKRVPEVRDTLHTWHNFIFIFIFPSLA
jgi:hypothetical protein